MHSFTEFVLYLVLLVIILIPLLAISFIIDNKFKIIWTIMLGIIGIVLWKKHKPSIEDDKTAETANDNPFEKYFKK